jgi:catechol 2,3-dioxygenase-like lactoylglutathione lyase family enzyme
VHVVFAVEDVTRAVEFYEHAFGWPRNDRIDFEEYVELHPPDGGSLGLYRRDGYARMTHATPAETSPDEVSPAYLYVRVPDVRGAIAKLESAGATPLAPLRPRAWGEEAAWFADPDGNVVAVAQPLQ